jgi:ATP-binding cassette, subfamily C, bacterial LapB
LPLVDGRLDRSLFLRAAERIGLHGEWQRRPLATIGGELLPLVVRCRDDRVVVVVARLASAWRVADPLAGEAEIELSDQELNDCYSGECCLIRNEIAPLVDRSQPARDTRPPGGRLLRQILLASRRLYGEVLLAAIFINLFVLATPLFVMNVYDRVVPNGAFETLTVLAIGVGIILLFDLLFKQLRSLFLDTAGKRADLRLSSTVFAQVLDLQRAAQPNSVGGFASQVKEFEGLREFISSATLVALIDLPFVVLFIVMIALIGGLPMALVPITLLPLVVVIGLFIVPRLRDRVTASLQDATRQQATLIEVLTSLETIKAQRAEGVMQGRWEYYLGRMANHLHAIHRLSTLATNLTAFVQQITYILVVVVGVFAVTAGELTLGGLIACSILASRAMGPVAQVAGLMSRYQQARLGLTSLNQILSMPVEHRDRQRFLHRERLAGDIRIEGLKLTYPNSQHLALNGINLQIAAGERVAILGRIGSGKSTLARALMGFYPPAEGAILLNNTDLRQLDPTFYRRHIGYVAQQPDLFAGSIRDNILISDPACSNDRLVTLAAATGVLDFVNRTSEGFDYQVGERAERLSGGQRQAIAITRALIHQPEIVIFDEPTSFMDNGSEETILRQLEPHLRGRTLIVITHRATLLKWVDRIIVLEEGRVALDGPKGEVIARLGGR